MPVQPNDYALVVGVDHYKSKNELLPLSSAVSDAVEMRKWLRDEDTGGGVPDDNCKEILSDPSFGKPTHELVDEKFGEIFALVDDRQTRARRLYFYFSGHGLAANEQQAFLVMPKWESKRRHLALDAFAFQIMLANSGRFEEIICLFDCCRSYKPNVRGLPSTWELALPHNQAGSTGWFTGFAAEFQKQAFEMQSGTVSHGFFTRALLSGLRGGACAMPGGATAQRLKEYLKSETTRLAELAGRKQNPRITCDFSGTAEPVFGSAPPLAVAATSPAVHVTGKLVYLVKVTGPANRQVVLVHPNDAEIAWDGSQPWRVEVGIGRHCLEDKSTGQMFRLPRDVTQGEIHVEF